MVSRNTLIIYAIVAIVVALGVFAYIYLQTPNVYSVTIGMRNLNPYSSTYPLETQVVQANLTNTGHTNIRNMTVVLYLNNTELDTYSVSVGAGQSALINATYTYTAPGNYSFDMVADPASLLNIQNRQSAHSQVSVSVLNPESPNPGLYESIPNTGVSTVQSFALEPSGIQTAAFLSTNYNLSIFNRLTGNDQRIIVQMLSDLTNYTSIANGAFVGYNDSSSAYVLWLQGEYGPSTISTIVRSFGISVQNRSIANNTVTFAQLSNSTTMCYYYGNGWSKIIEYQSTNASRNCATIMQSTYTPAINSTLTAALEKDSNVATYQSAFHYVNSTNLGSALLYSNGSVGAMNLFVQPDYKIIFASAVREKPKGYDVYSSTYNLTCTGLTYDIRNSSVMCATVSIPRNGTFGSAFAMLNSTLITSNYIVSLYSLGNSSEVLSSYSSSGALLQYLNISGTPYVWHSLYRSSCTLSNLSIGCSVAAFNLTTKLATFNITNYLGKPIQLNQISCYQTGSEQNYTVNMTIAAGKSLDVNTTCNAYYIQNTFSYYTPYYLLLNYSINGATKLVLGTTNITSFQQTT